ncbi:MAG: PA2169 family four-helix-bundle protein [Bacteroidota bacterium]|nr:PA2169 family four-helix-bundle protein [Bacteroidota bacterium]
MQAHNEEAIKQLNDLIEYCKDGQHGYKTAAEDVDNNQLKSTFQNFAQQREQFVSELKNEVRNLGGDPDKHGSATGALHRTWIDIKSVVAGGDAKAILAECDRGDSAAEKAYDEALRANLPSSALSVVRKQHDEVRGARNQIRSLSDTIGNK